MVSIKILQTPIEGGELLESSEVFSEEMSGTGNFEKMDKSAMTFGIISRIGILFILSF